MEAYFPDEAFELLNDIKSRVERIGRDAGIESPIDTLIHVGWINVSIKPDEPHHITFGSWWLEALRRAKLCVCGHLRTDHDFITACCKGCDSPCTWTPDQIANDCLASDCLDAVIAHEIGHIIAARDDGLIKGHEAEHAADKYGAAILGDPQALITLLRVMPFSIDEPGETHPSASSRIAALERLA